MNLYPHQETGAQWLMERRRAGLFDEQGLGKTATVIAAAQRLGLRRVLVLAPVVVAHNWAKEWARWAPEYRVQVVTSSAQEFDSSVHVTVTTHALLLRPLVAKGILERDWDLAVLDEAHYFKSPQAQRSQRFYGLGALAAGGVVRRAHRVWVLTGTPMPNDPSELWTMLAGLAPERIRAGTLPRSMTWHEFRGRYCKLAPSNYGDGWKVTGVNEARLPELRERLQGFALRRLKTDHLDLPPIRWGTVELTVDRLPDELLELEADLPTDPEAALEALAAETAFSTWRRLCGITKAAAAVDLLVSELGDSWHKIVVFCHHTAVANLLCSGLAGFGVVRITGDTTAAQRQAAVDAFQRPDGPRVAVCQIVAGGTGVTLTAAADVVFVESSFVPGENLQAADRCHRIGQSRPVAVRILSLAGSVDTLLAEIVARKSSMIRSVLQPGA